MKDHPKALAVVRAVCAVDDAIATFSLRQLSLFLFLNDAKQAISNREVAAGLGVNKPTVTRTVDKLCSLGLVQRKPDYLDRRLISLSVTPKGTKLAERVAVALREAA
jgi:DNA-binding MarR family transcriptional regulator